MNTKTIPVLVGAMIVGLILFVTLNQLSSSSVEKDVKAQYLKGGDFSLSNGDKPFQLQSLKGKAVVLYFGFTFCPDVCPLGLSVIRDAFNNLSEDNEVAGVFVTVDPERDTHDKMQEYVSFFHEDILGITGTLEEINVVTKLYGTYFKKGQVDENGNYSVDHTAYYYIIDRVGELVRVLDHNAKPEEISALLSKL